MLSLQTGILIVIVVVIEFACFVWAMVVWDNMEIDITTNMQSYFKQMIENTEHNNIDSIRWDRLHVRVGILNVSYLT